MMVRGTLGLPWTTSAKSEAAPRSAGWSRLASPAASAATHCPVEGMVRLLASAGGRNATPSRTDASHAK